MKSALCVCVLVVGISVTGLCVPPCVGATHKSASTTPSAFLAYLTDTKNVPTLIDYSPTEFDPRHGKHFRLPSESSIQQDLSKLRDAFDGLVVYSYHPQVTPLVVREAKRQGYKAVVLGIWDARSSTEITGVLDLINKYHNDIAFAVCLGNEGLYFQRYTVEDLYAAAERLRTELGHVMTIPITTSEPWIGYRNEQVRGFGDFLAPNIHPVWIKPALPAKDAVQWTRTQAMMLMESAQKPVLVKETGFPHGGQRHFTPQAQQKFWEMYVREDRLVYSSFTPNLWVSFAASFEAFSLPWKAEESGEPIEAAWGLMDKDRNPLPAFYAWGRK